MAVPKTAALGGRRSYSDCCLGCYGSSTCVGFVSVKCHFDQYSLVLRILFVGLLGALSFRGEWHQRALCFGLSSSIDLLEDHDMCLALHFVSYSCSRRPAANFRQPRSVR